VLSISKFSSIVVEGAGVQPIPHTPHTHPKMQGVTRKKKYNLDKCSFCCWKEQDPRITCIGWEEGCFTAVSNARDITRLVKLTKILPGLRMNASSKKSSKIHMHRGKNSNGTSIMVDIHINLSVP